MEKVVTALQAVLEFLGKFESQLKWLPVPMFSDWGRGSTPNKLGQYTRDPLGRVELRGEVKTVAGTATTIGTLPVGFRPVVGCSFPITAYNGGVVNGRIDVQAGGRIVLITPAVAANIEVYLDGIRFDTRE